MPESAVSGAQAALPSIEVGQDSTFAARWAQVVAALPHQPALVSPGVSYTFADADTSSRRAAAQLLSRLGPGQSPIGVLVDQTADGLLAILAAGMTGRPAVLFDPVLPADRLRHIAESTGVKVCLVDGEGTRLAPALGTRDVDFLPLSEALSAGRADVEPAALPQAKVPTGEDPFCVLFTSGSTGTPKGVLMRNNQLVNDAYAGGAVTGLGRGDRVALVLPPSFAAGLVLIAKVLLNGAGVWAYDPRRRGVRGLADYLQQERVTALYSTPHLLRSLLDTLGDDEVLEYLRLMVTGGEAIYARDVLAARAHLTSSSVFVNWAGASEVGNLCYHLVPADAPLPEGALPGGHVTPNKDVFLMRDNGSTAGPGEAGQIVVVSDYLSGGYWHNPILDARFGTADDGRRTYLTGDRGRIDEEGNLHLLGRIDAAVKVRGYLVEPREIEAAILASDHVAEAVVVPIASQGEQVRLVAYVSPSPNLQTESPGALRRRLRATLPEYMVPAVVVSLPSLPRTDRGKVDRQALPPAPSALEPPVLQDPRERVVADLWGELLGLTTIGSDDDFMALGGDSLLVEEMLVRAEERFSISLASADLLGAPTLAQFTRRVHAGSSVVPRHPTVASLSSSGDQTPLFCFAGAGALALSFLPLSHHLVNRPVYAFQAAGLEARGLPDWSIASAARRHIQTLRLLQPAGPYLLAGHSFGGLLALEVARLLRSAGERVDLVALLDTYLPGPWDTAHPSSPGTPYRRPGARGARTNGQAKPRRNVSATKLSRLAGRALPYGFPPLRQWPERARIPLAGLVQFRGVRQFEVMFDHGQVVSRWHRVTPYDGRALLVLASGNPNGSEAWQPLLLGEADVQQFTCEHSSLLREPHVSELAALMQITLDKLER